MENCIFCKIIAGQIPATKFYEDDEMVIISDIDPKAKYHYLLLLKEHFPTLEEMTAKQGEKLAAALKKLPALAEKLHLEGGYRLVINQGEDAGQTVPHLHVHILAGQKMGWQPA